MLVNAGMALAAIIAATEAKGLDHRYLDSYLVCAYVAEDGPSLVCSCIVGRALHRLGVPMLVIAHLRQGAEITREANLRTLADANFPLTALALEVMRRAQYHQDSGSTDADALTDAMLAFVQGIDRHSGVRLNDTRAMTLTF